MSPMSSRKIYVFDSEHFFALDPEESVGYGISDLPEFFTWVSGYRCEKCGQIMVLSGEAELVETAEREMGSEYFYHHENSLECPQCQHEIEIEIELDYYALGWTCDEEISGVESITIDGLEWLAKEYFKSEKASTEKEELEGRASMLTSRLSDLLKQARQNQMYVLIVEGKDDRAIWEQFLRREDVPLDWVDIPIYEDGGLNEALKKAAIFRGKRLRLIPHKLIIDSDNDMKSALEELKKKHIDKKDYCVLKEKEIESYLLEEEAIAHVLSVDVDVLHEFNASLKGSGKERLDNIFIHFGHPKPNDQVKGLIARALKKVPEEIGSIIKEIKASLTTHDIEDYEDYS